MVPFGLFVALDDVFVEGLVHISDLGSDYFHYDDAHHSLLGERTGERYRLSDRIRVQLVRVNMEASKIDFRLVAGPARATERVGKTARDKLVERPLAPESVAVGKPARRKRVKEAEFKGQVAPALPPVEQPEALAAKAGKPKEAKADRKVKAAKADKPAASKTSKPTKPAKAEKAATSRKSAAGGVKKKAKVRV